MKKILFSSIALLAIGAALTGCSDEIGYNTGGEGRVYLRTKVSTDVKVVSRVAQENAELAANSTIWISNAKGAVRKYKGIDEVPSEGIRLVAGNYVAEAWTGDSVAASFDTRWFKGREEFTITDNSVTQVELVCKIANSVVSLTYEDGVADVLTDCSFTIGHNGGKLTFDATTPADAKGYFMMSSYDKDLTYTLTGTRTDGKGTFTTSGVIKDAKPTTEYRIRVKHDGTVVEPIGGAYIQIVVDETPLEEISDTYELSAAPVITGIGYDITKPVVGSSGAVEAKSLWIAATSSLSDINVNCQALMTALGIEGEGFEIFHVTDAVKSQLNAAGISWVHFTHEGSDFEEVKLVFSDEALSKLPKGDHAIVIEATDATGRTGRNTLNVKVTDASVETIALEANSPAIWATHATVSGRVLKSGLGKVGVKYAPAGTTNWTTVWADAVPSVGSEYTVELTGLTGGTRYDFRAVADDVEAPAASSFTTETAAQLPNAGFEEWSNSTKKNNPIIPASSDANLFWDSGNHGSATLGKNITDKDSSVKHSGSYSAKLASQFVGLGAIGKFAAGNIFVGEYLKTAGTDGVLGWGRTFTSRPKQMKVWVKYEPATVQYCDANNSDGVQKGDMDKGIIYIALTGAANMDYEGTKWAQVVKTKSSERQLFDKNGSNVIAYGEHVFTTSDSNMVEVTIDLDYRSTTLKPENIIVVASASKMGDYFTGGNSTMWIDDIELVY